MNDPGLIPVPPEQFDAFRALLLKQRGAMSLYAPEGGAPRSLFDGLGKENAFLSTTAGAHVFQIISDGELRLSFRHSSPGTGTRIATLNLADITRTDRLRVYFDWSPEAITLCVLSRDDDANRVCATGIVSTFTRIYALPSGEILTVGMGGSNVGLRVNGVDLFQKPAIDAWNETREGIEVLLTGDSTKSPFERIICNVALVMLVTGLEVYLQSRFREMEAEGVSVNDERLATLVLTDAETRAGGISAVRDEARQRGTSPFALLFERMKHHFQNFDRAKAYFNRAYHIKFGTIVSSQVIGRIRRLIAYRHRIVHYSPADDILNWAWTPTERPEIANRQLAAAAIAVFAEFIGKVHAAGLRPVNSR